MLSVYKRIVPSSVVCSCTWVCFGPWCCSCEFSHILFPRRLMKFPWCNSSRSNSKTQHQASASSPGYKTPHLILHSHGLCLPGRPVTGSSLSACSLTENFTSPLSLLIYFCWSLSSVWFDNQTSFFAGKVAGMFVHSFSYSLFCLSWKLLWFSHVVHRYNDRSRQKLLARSFTVVFGADAGFKSFIIMTLTSFISGLLNSTVLLSILQINMFSLLNVEDRPIVL